MTFTKVLDHHPYFSLLTKRPCKTGCKLTGGIYGVPQAKIDFLCIINRKKRVRWKRL